MEQNKFIELRQFNTSNRIKINIEKIDYVIERNHEPENTGTVISFSNSLIYVCENYDLIMKMILQS